MAESTLRPFNIKIKTSSKYEGNEKKKTKEKIHVNPGESCSSYVSAASFYLKYCVAYMYLKVALRISEL